MKTTLTREQVLMRVNALYRSDHSGTKARAYIREWRERAKAFDRQAREARELVAECDTELEILLREADVSGIRRRRKAYETSAPSINGDLRKAIHRAAWD